MTSLKFFKLNIVMVLVAFGLVSGVGRIKGAGQSQQAMGRGIPAIPSELFAPSNARTEDGKLIPVEHFISSARCQSCHQDTHQAWSESLHRNAAREPFYRESADILLRTRGIEFTRHCESCHTPVALFSGALSKESKNQKPPFTPLDHEGVTCSVCHSITEARLDGTGSFTIRRPALLAKEDSSPVYGDFTNEQILADIPGHKRAVMRPLLRQPEFCATCHKVDAPPSLNGYKHIKGFSAYDEWQRSGASRESLTTFYRREQRTDCRACHMPKIESTNDRAAKNGKIASHRWLGANTAAPLFYDQIQQVELTKDFLQTGVLDVDIFALRNAASNELITPLDLNAASTPALRGNEIVAEVVVSNRNAAHSFPPEVRDLYEAWVEFEAIDNNGKKIFQSGFIQADGLLDEGAHVYKTIILDEQGRHITRHQIWLTNIKAYDNTILPGRSDVVRFGFRLNSEIPMPITLRARVNYRRLNQEYTNYVLKQQKRNFQLPIIKMAEAELKIGSSNSTVSSQTPHWKRWNDYGIGLLEQAQFGPAADAFRKAAELDPHNPDLLVNAAIAEMRTERFAPEREQFRKAEVLLNRALSIPRDLVRDPVSITRARFYRALVWRSDGKAQNAIDELGPIACNWPRDREVQRQYAQTLYLLGKLPRARSVFESILTLDPTDAGVWQFLWPLYASEGRRDKAEYAQSRYLQWRDDPQADLIGTRFFAAHPQWADERVLTHVHKEITPSRPVLIGPSAAPEN